MIISSIKPYLAAMFSRRSVQGKGNPVKFITLFFLITFIFPLYTAFHTAMIPVQFTEKSIWIQVGNQIKDIDDSMFQLIVDCRFNKIILLNSAVDQKGYFPVIESLLKRCRPRGIKVSMGDLVFKEVYLKDYWKKYPHLRKCTADGRYVIHNYYRCQICPNNPVNQEYIAQLLVEKAKQAGVDEIHIDYECTACYCDYCVNDFMKQFKKNPRLISPEDLDWLDWRSRKTSRFFQWLALKVSSSAPGTKISATAPIIGTPAGFTEYGIDLRYEDLSEYVDEFVPMIYISEKLPARLAGRKHDVIKRRLPGKYVTPGLMLAEEQERRLKTAPRVNREMISVFRAGARSIVVFEVRFINDEIKDLLQSL